MNIIRIGHITSYLDHNVIPVLHSLVMVMDIICIGHITSYLAHDVRHIFHIYSYSEIDWCSFRNNVAEAWSEYSEVVSQKFNII